MAGSRIINASKRTVPNYPGRDAAERVVRPVVEHVAGDWIRRYADRQVLRLVGFHTVWHELAKLGEPEPFYAMIDRNIVKGRTAADVEADFVSLFGCDVSEITHAELMHAVGIVKPYTSVGRRARAKPRNLRRIPLAHPSTQQPRDAQEA